MLVWGVSVFIQLLLPIGCNNALFLFGLALAGVIAFLARLRDVIELVKSLQPKDFPTNTNILIANIDEDQCDLGKLEDTNIICQ